MQYLGEYRKSSNQRQEERNHPRLFVEISPLDDQDGNRLDALTSDFSETGVGLVTFIPYPVGTLVAIFVDGNTMAKGEVINIDPWDCCGLIRMGVRFIEKYEDWPLN
jgi:hypothetical protein